MFGDIFKNAILYSHIDRNGNIHIGIFETFAGGECELWTKKKCMHVCVRVCV